MGSLFADAVAAVAEAEEPYVVRVQMLERLNDEAFWRLCQQNPELQIEQSAEGDLILMAPASSGSSYHNGSLTGQLYNWAKADGTGRWFDSSGGFRLPSGAIRSPDAAWARISRLASLPADAESRFLPICPDFVVELRSPSDRLRIALEKMEEYIANGAFLGWLIDPKERTVRVYRPSVSTQLLINPSEVSAAPELPGFVLDVTEIWQPLI